jgi:hypothetical protein
MVDEQSVQLIFQSVQLMFQHVGGVSNLLSVLAYIAGIGFGFKAVLAFKNCCENPGQVPISVPGIYAFLSFALISLPSMLMTTGPHTMLGNYPIEASKEGKGELVASATPSAASEQVQGAKLAEREAASQEALAAREKADAAKKELDRRAALAKAESIRKAELAKSRFEAAERSAAGELAAKGLGGASAQSTESTSGDEGAWGLILGALATLGAAGLGWAKWASKRIRREGEQTALPVVDLGAGSSRR